MIPSNYDNPSPLASLDPARWKDAQAKRQGEEEREERERYGATTVEESLACLKAWGEWNQQQKEKDDASGIDTSGTTSGGPVARSA